MLVEDKSVLTLAGFTQLGAAPVPFDCRICREAPDPLLPIRAPDTTRFDDTVTAWLAAPKSAAFATVIEEVKVCGAVQSWFTLRYATEDGSTVLGIPDTMFTPARLVMPEPLPEMIPLLTTKLLDTVTLEI